MVRGSRFLLRHCAADHLTKAVSDFLVCPLSKQPLRHCQETQTLVSEAIGVAYPIVDGVPCLVPKDGKLLEDQDFSKGEMNSTPSDSNN